MLTEITIENFKPFGIPQRIPLAPITLIYGPNSGGKSSIIQSLLLMKQSIESAPENPRSLISRGSMVDLGSFASMVHKHEQHRMLRFRYAFASQEPNAPFQIGFSFGTADSRSGAVLKEVILQLNSQCYTLTDASDVDLTNPYEGHGLKPWHWKNDAEQQIFVERLLREYQTVEEQRIQEMETESELLAARKKHTESRLLVYKIQVLKRDLREMLSNRDQVAQYLLAYLKAASFVGLGFVPQRLEQKILEDINPSIKDLLQKALRTLNYQLNPVAQSVTGWFRSLSYLGPLRSPPERFYLLSELQTQTVGKQGEHMPQLLFRHQDAMVKRINSWFKQFEMPYTLQVHLDSSHQVVGELLSLTLMDQRSGVEVAPSDVGFGIGQFLPILVEGALAHRRVICVEQPEIHLHPRLQAEIADFLIDTAGLADSKADQPELETGNQWIIETHSEALMLRLQKRIRKGELRPQDVSVLYIEPDIQSGKTGSRVIPLRLDREGDFIDEWPHGFFEERFTEVFGD